MDHFRRLLLFGVFVVSAALYPGSSACAQSQLVQNGTFLTPVANPATAQVLGPNSTALTGWTVSQGSIEFGSSFGPDPNVSGGSQAVELAGGRPTAQGAIEQTITTAPGLTYMISIDAKDHATTPVATGSFDFGSQAAFTINPSSDSFVTSTWTLTATSSSTLIKIIGYGSPSSDQLIVDNVSVTSIPTDWVGGHTTSWGNALNWSATNSPPGGAGAEITFGSQAAANSVVDLGSSNRSVGILNFVSATNTTIQSASGNSLVMDNAGSTAVVTVAGTQTINAGVSLNSSAAITVTSGTDQLTFGGSIADGTASNGITLSGAGMLVLAAPNTYSGPTNVLSGTLVLSNGSALQNSTLASGSVVFSSSVVSHAFTFGGLASGTNLALTDNAGNPVALSVGNNGSYAVYSGALSGGGSLTQNGSGVTTLLGSNTDTGPSTILAGTLALGATASIAQSPTISLANGATLDVSAQTNFALLGTQTLSGTGNYYVNGALTSNSGATILPGGVASAGTLNVGGLTLNPGSMLKYDLGSPGAPGDLINVTNYGGLTVNGGGIDLYQSNGTTTFNTGGTYTLMNYAGALGSSGPNLSVLNPILGDSYTFSATGGSLDVTIVVPNVWNGGGKPAFNWSQPANWSSSQAPVSGSALLFAGTTGLSNSNDIANLSLSGITFAGSAGAFNISGNSIQLSGPIANFSTPTQTIGLAIALAGGNQTVNAAAGNIVLNGAVSDGGAGLGLNMTGSATVVLGAANTYSGPTTVSGGVLNLAHPLGLQDSTVNMAGGGLSFAAGIMSPILGGLSGSGNVNLATVSAQSVALNVGNNGQNTTYGGSLTGPGSLVKQGAGTLTLAAPQYYSGPTIISGGVLQLATFNSAIGIGSLPATTPVTISNGSTFDMTNNSQTIGSLSSTDGMGSQVLLGGGVLTIAGPGVTTFDGVISGNGGSLVVQGGGLTLTGVNTYSGATSVSGGLLQLSSSNGPAIGGNLVVSGGTAQLLQSNQIASTANASVSAGLLNIGANSNSLNGLQITGGTIAGTTGALTSATNYDAQNGVISAILAGSVGLNKTTAGTVVLSAPNTYTGVTNITAGALTLANPQAGQNSTVNVNGGALAFSQGATSPILGGLEGAGNVALATAASEPVALNVGSDGQSTTYSGVLTGPGSLVKQGTGTLTLNALQTYSGPTLISGGVLQLQPQSPGGGVAVHFEGNDGTSVTGLAGVVPIGNWNNFPKTIYIFTNQALTDSSGNNTTVTLSSTANSGGGGTNNATNPVVDGYLFANNYNTLTATLSGIPYASYSLYAYFADSSPGAGEQLTFDGTTYYYATSSSPTYTQVTNTTAGTYPVGNYVVATGLSSATQTLSVQGITNQYGSLCSLEIVNTGPSSASVLPATTAVTISNGSTLDMTNVAQTIASLSSTDGMGSQVLMGSGALTIAGTASTTFDGTISGAGGSLTLQGGELTLTGTNTYTGGTIVANGTLILDDNAALADGSSLTVGQDAAQLFAAPVAIAASPPAAVAVPEPGKIALLLAALWSAAACRRFAKKPGAGKRQPAVPFKCPEKLYFARLESGRFILARSASEE
jgi:fibronectin-binding autotransporter adhesin